MQIVCTSAYVPQEKDSVDKKMRFWDYLDEDAKRAENEGKGFILQGDLNAWLGKNHIEKDHRKQNENGKLMADFLERNDLTVVNSLSLCTGTFTRIRKRKDMQEKSIIDFFVVCKRILPHITSMHIDEDKKEILTNYSQVHKGKRAVDCDHVPLEININLKLLPTKPIRSVKFNFRNELGREKFQELTSLTNDFTDCLESMQPLQLQFEQWEKILMTYCEKSFPKIRVRIRKIRKTAADNIIQERNVLKKRQDENRTTSSEDKILIDLENKISKILAEEERSKSLKFKRFCADYGSVSLSEM